MSWAVGRRQKLQLTVSNINWLYFQTIEHFDEDIDKCVEYLTFKWGFQQFNIDWYENICFQRFTNSILTNHLPGSFNSRRTCQPPTFIKVHSILLCRFCLCHVLLGNQHVNLCPTWLALIFDTASAYSQCLFLFQNCITWTSFDMLIWSPFVCHCTDLYEDILCFSIEPRYSARCSKNEIWVFRSLVADI